MANAEGLSYMRIRMPDGSFQRAQTEAQIDAAIAAGATLYHIYMQAPNTASCSLLFSYLFGQPVQRQEHTGKEGEPLEVLLKILEEGRRRNARREVRRAGVEIDPAG